MFHALLGGKSMNRPFFKRTLLAAVSLMLLYYNVAWAVLRCPHQEDHADHELVVYETGRNGATVFLSSPSHRHVDLDCAGPKYHTEWLVGPSTNSELLRLARDVASRVNVFFGLSSLALDQVGNFWLIALSDKPSATLPFGLPLYISLSVLRI